MSTPLSRRTFTVGSLAAIFAGPAAISLSPLDLAAAQATPGLASLDLPTLDVTVAESGYEGIPEEIEAGRYLVNVTLSGGMEEGGVSFVSPPPGMTVQDFLGMVGMGGGGGTPMASPPPASGAGEEEEAEEGGEMEMLPLFVYRATFAGGAAGAGGAIQGVVDLPPGEWFAWADDPTASQQPFVFTVTGEMPADLAEPESDITLTFIDFAIDVEGTLTAGDHLMLLQNHGAQPHFLVLLKGPDSMTDEMVAMLLESEMSGATPEALPFDPDKDLMPVAFTATQSIGTMQWVPVSLEAGTYLAACFFPTAGEGLPHAYHGMHKVFTVQ